MKQRKGSLDGIGVHAVGFVPVVRSIMRMKQRKGSLDEHKPVEHFMLVHQFQGGFVECFF